MTNEEILKKAVEKAIKNGWDILGDDDCIELMKWNIDEGLGLNVYEEMYPDEGSDYYSLNDVIFSHDFAKAFWGEESIEAVLYDRCIKPCRQKGRSSALINVKAVVFQKAWRVHLKEMVLEENPIKYLERFI